MTSKYLAIDKILTILKETPPRLAKLTAGLTPVQLHSAPSAGEWSANEVLAHLRACNEVWGGYYIMTILAQDKPTIKAINPRTWIKNTDYLEQEFQLSLRAFTKQRRKLLAILEPLPPRDWTRTKLLPATAIVGSDALHPASTDWSNDALHTHPLAIMTGVPPEGLLAPSHMIRTARCLQRYKMHHPPG